MFSAARPSTLPLWFLALHLVACGGAVATTSERSERGAPTPAPAPTASDSRIGPLPGPVPASRVPACGGKTGGTCRSDQYCDFGDASCGGTDRAGECRGRPQGCSTLYAPVCGCDDKTYPNDCVAHQAGASIRKDGSCTSFACGSATCDAQTQYCEGTDTGNDKCLPLPKGCQSTSGRRANCSCFESPDPCIGCVPVCAEQDAGPLPAFTLYWPN